MLDIGICAYRNGAKLRKAVECIQRNTIGDWRLLIFNNPAEGSTVEPVLSDLIKDTRIHSHTPGINIGYAGAVNHILSWAEAPHIAYFDHDAYVQTRGWDFRMAAVLDGHAEVGWVFPGPGHFGFQSNGYRECLWNAGYCWMIRRRAVESVNTLFDPTLGHHEEVDFMIRLRLAGWRIAAVPEVQVIHDETATQANPADHKPGGRIHDGVVRWMNKWNRYFCGDDLKYSMTAYDARALRYTDWPPCALYLERMTLARFPKWNQTVETVEVPEVGPMDAVKVLKPLGPYRGRAI